MWLSRRDGKTNSLARRAPSRAGQWLHAVPLHAHLPRGDVGSGGLISGSLSHSPHESDLSSSHSQGAFRLEARTLWCLPAGASIIEY